MAISEAARSDLYNGLRDVIGPERTETLMSAIAWHTIDEVATKGDLANLEARLIRTITNWMVTILVAVIGAIVGVGLLS
jgi:hypothetical protein